MICVTAFHHRLWGFLKTFSLRKCTNGSENLTTGHCDAEILQPVNQLKISDRFITPRCGTNFGLSSFLFLLKISYEIKLMCSYQKTVCNKILFVGTQMTCLPFRNVMLKENAKSGY